VSDSSKFARLDKPTSLGTSCWTCNTSAHREGFVQFNGRNVPGYGTVAICAGCVYELSRVVACLDPEQAERLRVELAELSVASELGEVLEALKKQTPKTKVSS
jgi:hypothetical protein